VTISKSVSLFTMAIAALSAPTTVAPAIADPGSSCHFHGTKPAEEKVILACAAKRIDTLVAKGKVDAAWKTRPHESVEVVQGSKGKEWKVVFADPAPKDAQKSKLYLFFTHSGNFLAANHTGK